MGALLALLPALTTILDRVLPDPEAKQKALADLLEVAQKGDLAQLEVNKAEASSGNWFASSWRPLIGWIGGLSLAWHYLAKPMLLAFASYMDEKLVTAILSSPGIDENMWALILSMLGMGGLRTYEKMKGVAK